MINPDDWKADFLDSLADEWERTYFEGAIVYLEDYLAADDDPEPEPPSPAVSMGDNAAESTVSSPENVVHMDRHTRAVIHGQSGGLTTFERYGSQHFRLIGKAGYQATKNAYGVPFVVSLLRSKGWFRPQGTTLQQDLSMATEQSVKSRPGSGLNLDLDCAA